MLPSDPNYDTLGSVMKSDLPSVDKGAGRPRDPRIDAAILSATVDLLVEIGYGTSGQPTCNYVPAPEAWASDNTECLTQDIAGANALLDEAGWTMGGNGVREKDGVQLNMVFQTSVNAVRACSVIFWSRFTSLICS